MINNEIITSFNKVFGYFELEENKIYSVDLNTKGRQPILKNNNMFISRKRLNELVEEEKIESIKNRLRYIAGTFKK